jgi:hypothetical protein
MSRLFLVMRFEMRVQFLLVVMAIVVCLALWKAPETYSILVILALILLVNKTPWWLERKNLELGAFPIVGTSLIAMLAVIFSAPTVVIVCAYGLVALSLAVAAFQTRRKENL